MHDVAWRGMEICVRSKYAQKQLARTSLTDLSADFVIVGEFIILRLLLFPSF